MEGTQSRTVFRSLRPPLRPNTLLFCGAAVRGPHLYGVPDPYTEPIRIEELLEHKSVFPCPSTAPLCTAPTCSGRLVQRLRVPSRVMRPVSGSLPLFILLASSRIRFGSTPSQHLMNNRRLGDVDVYRHGSFGPRLLLVCATVLVSWIHACTLS